MDNKDLIKKLTSLAQLDIDAVIAYDQALEKIENLIVHDDLAKFRDDHRQHFVDLNQHIRDLGGEVVQEKADIKGLLIEGFTVLRSATGTEGALKAIQSNEKVVKKTYEKALEDVNLPVEIKSLLIKNCDDERRQLAYIEQTIAESSWRFM